MAKAIDPVCRMEVDPATAPAKSEYQGQTYYFCAPGCKREFDKDPSKYAGQGSGGTAAHEHHHGHGGADHGHGHGHGHHHGHGGRCC